MCILKGASLVQISTMSLTLVMSIFACFTVHLTLYTHIITHSGNPSSSNKAPPDTAPRNADTRTESNITTQSSISSAWSFTDDDFEEEDGPPALPQRTPASYELVDGNNGIHSMLCFISALNVMSCILVRVLQYLCRNTHIICLIYTYIVLMVTLLWSESSVVRK